jgi:cell division transport system permease protein
MSAEDLASESCASRPPVLRRAVSRGLARFTGRRARALVPQARLAGPMPWVIAIMTALMVIAAAGALALGSMARAASADLSGGITVQILEANEAERDRQAELVVAELGNSTLIDSVRRVPDDELADLLEPWLGDLSDTGTGADAIPVPALVDAQLNGPVTPQQLERLRALVAASAPSARVDAQSGWLAPVFSAIDSLQWLAIALIALLSIATIAAVWLAARTALGTNRETISIVHLLGGTDRQIARIFQRSIAFDAAIGGLVGLLLGIGAVVILARQFSGLGSGMVAGAALGPLDFALLAAIPFAGVALAAFTARLTVMRALRAML